MGSSHARRDGGHAYPGEPAKAMARPSAVLLRRLGPDGSHLGMRNGVRRQVEGAACGGQIQVRSPNVSRQFNDGARHNSRDYHLETTAETDCASNLSSSLLSAQLSGLTITTTVREQVPSSAWIDPIRSFMTTTRHHLKVLIMTTMPWL